LIYTNTNSFIFKYIRYFISKPPYIKFHSISIYNQTLALYLFQLIVFSQSLINFFCCWCYRCARSLIGSRNKHIINISCQIQKKRIRVKINLVSTLSKHPCDISCCFNSLQINIRWVTFNSFTEILCR